MKQRIITQIIKKLNITEEYLAGYLGITFSFLETIKQAKGWSKDGKDLRIYRLNKVINILRNKGLKNPEDFKNILDNERFKFTDGEEDEDFSYINIINCQLVDMSELVNHLVFEIKTEYIMKKSQISRSMLAGILDTTESKLKNKLVQLDKLYMFIKKVIKIKKEFHLSILQEPFNELGGNTPLLYILEDSGFYSKLLPNIELIITEFYKE